MTENKMTNEEFDESIKKYYQDKMKEHSKKENPIYVDLNKLIKEFKAETLAEEKENERKSKRL